MYHGRISPHEPGVSANWDAYELAGLFPDAKPSEMVASTTQLCRSIMAGSAPFRAATEKNCQADCKISISSFARHSLTDAGLRPEEISVSFVCEGMVKEAGTDWQTCRRSLGALASKTLRVFESLREEWPPPQQSA